MATLNKDIKLVNHNAFTNQKNLPVFSFVTLQIGITSSAMTIFNVNNIEAVVIKWMNFII